MVSVFDAAKHLCKESGWQLTNLQLQKLIYLAHMFHLGLFKSPLIEEHFEAWNYGPVQPDLYHKAKVYGSDPVENIFRSASDLDENSTEAMMLDKVLGDLSAHTPARLVALTHWDKGAWAKHYEPNTFGCYIPNSDIAIEYRDRVHAAEERKQQAAQ